MTLYVPPIVFDRNAHLVPLLVRVADLIWCGAGLSCFQSKHSRSTITIPTAVYTLTLPLVRLVGGWDAGPEAIGEDMHMMLKCYFATHGRLSVESIPSPASQCNVASSRKAGIRGWLHSHHARYVQGLRHMWGCLDTGFAIKRWFKLGSNSHAMFPHTRNLSHKDSELNLVQDKLHGDGAARFTWRNVVLFTRLFEAHILPAHLLIVLLASTSYTKFAAPLVRCRYLTLFLNVTATLRAFSFLVMIVYFFFFYERYHRVCVEARAAEMKRVGLYEEFKHHFSYRRRSSPGTWLEYVIFPISGTAFGGAPLIHAAFAHFWSDRLGYTVTEKPGRLVDVPAEDV